jgi:hypothetical protein
MPHGAEPVKRLIFALSVIAALSAHAGADPSVTFIGEYTWDSENPVHGGFSGLSVSADGGRFLAITDKGRFASGRLLRDGAAISGVADASYGQMLSSQGAPLRGADDDSEGLALAPDGTVYVSFEGNDRIAVSAGIGNAPGELLRAPEFRDLQANSGLEALALAPDGTVMTIPERSGEWERPFPVYRWRGGTWLDTWSIPRTGEYLVSDAAFGPDGKLYVLERELAWFNLGFSSRVRRFVPGPSGLDAGETLLETSYGAHGNLEGLSVWSDDQDRIRLTMIADNNFRSFLSTQFVEYAVTE